MHYTKPAHLFTSLTSWHSYDLDLPVLLDTSEDTFNTWGVKTLPTSFLLDAEGNIRYRVRGNPDWDDKDTIAVIEQLISEHTTKNELNIEPASEASK